MLFHHCLDSVSHSGSLRLWPSPLPSLLLLSPFFEFRFFVSPKSEPSRSFRTTRFLAASLLVFPLTLLPLSPLSYFFSASLTQWVIPAHWVFRNLLSLPCFRPPPTFTFSLIPVGLSDPLGYLLCTLELPPLPSSPFCSGSSSWGSKVTRCSPSRFHRSLLYLIKSTDWAIPLAPCPHTNHTEYGKE